MGSGHESHEVPYLAAPARAKDLSGLPPTFIDVGSGELFRDEDVAVASRILSAGGNAELHVWPGGFHGYYELLPDAAITRATKETRIGWLRHLLPE